SRKLGKIDRKSTIVVAPRGVLYQGAMKRKIGKKVLFLVLSRLLGIYKNVRWHATSELEKLQIEEIFGQDINVVISRNLTANYNQSDFNKKLKKEKGKLKVIFLSRIHPKKNLLMAIELLQHVKGIIDFNIYGPIEDKDYWKKCVE